MNKLDILLKCIILLHREHTIKDSLNDNSHGLVRSIVNLHKDKNLKRGLVGGETDVIESLSDLIIDMINHPDGYDKSTLIQSIHVALSQYPNWLPGIEKQLDLESNVGGLKRSIVSLRTHLNNFYKESEIAKVIKKASYDLTVGRLEESVQEFTAKLITNLEALSNVTKTKDVAIVDEIDLEDDEELEKIFKKVKSQNDESGRLKTGWKELNEMLLGGFRRGEMVLTSALQHNYKSGFCQSLFAQLCMFNKPTLLDQNKKPLALFISFEDDSDIITKFLYNYLYYSENNELPNMLNTTPKELGSYIKERLTNTGFNIKILRINPSDWTYKAMFNKILEYEADGYELQILFIDYLSKLPTTGCINSGPSGTDIRDLMNRVRNFCNNSSRQALVLTPHQMSTDCKQLLRNGVNGPDLVKEIAGKGYYEGSKQIDQVVDLEIHQHIAKINKLYYLTLQRGKRRYPEIVDDNKKYAILPFPSKAPIPPNMCANGEYVGFKYAPTADVIKRLDDEFDL